jgi:signal transduction histidine kinase
LLTCLRLPRELGTSREWVRLYGFPFDGEAPDLVTRHFESELYPELRAAMVSQFLAPFRSETSIRSEHRAPTLAGDVIVRSHWKASISDGVPDYTRIVIVDIDVTDLHEIERSLEEVVESKDRLIASISHELRNPLTAVVGFSSILASDWETMDDDTRYEMVSEIAEQVGDVSALLDDFLAVNSGGVLQVDDAVVPLDSIMSRIDVSGVTVDVDADLAVRGDALRIRQIVRNLVRNAQRHGGADVVVKSATADGRVTIEVVDDGLGVPPEIADRLFQPYSHGGKAGSLGLGLAVSLGLARAMDGDLRYRRENDHTVFTLEMRRA